jgi:hypothetical protein
MTCSRRDAHSTRHPEHPPFHPEPVEGSCRSGRGHCRPHGRSRALTPGALSSPGQMLRQAQHDLSCGAAPIPGSSRACRGILPGRPASAVARMGARPRCCITLFLTPARCFHRLSMTSEQARVATLGHPEPVEGSCRSGRGHCRPHGRSRALTPGALSSPGQMLRQAQHDPLTGLMPVSSRSAPRACGGGRRSARPSGC